MTEAFSKNKITYLTTFIFTVMSAIVLLRHEMWRDELQSWTIAAGSNSISGLLFNLQCEGHPPLWHFLLFIISRFTDNPAWMKVLHLLISTTTIFIFNKRAPFTTFQKILFSFGYYSFFEYNIISRNYVLGILGIILFISQFYKPNRNNILLWLALFLMFFSNAYSFIIGICFSVLLIFDYLKLKMSKVNLAVVLVLLSAMALVSLYTFYPGKDCWQVNIMPAFEFPRFFKITGLLFKSFFVFPKLNCHFWNTNIISSAGIQTIISGIVGAITCFYFLPDKKALLFYITATFLILLFSYMVHLSYQRHIGHLFYVFICGFWLYKANNVEKHASYTFDKVFSVLFHLVLISGLITGVFANIIDFRYPFSQSENTAAYIKAEKLDSLVIAGSPDYIIGPVAARIGRKVYYPESGELATFIKWNKLRKTYNQADALLKINEFAGKQTGEILIILNHKAPDSLLSSLTKLTEFTGCIVTDEIYYLYLSKKDK